MGTDTGTGRAAVIIGAGVGGLAAANALYRTGWRVTVLERADALRPIGAGIALPPNAMHALDAVDLGGATLGERVRAVGDSAGAIGARRPDGTWIFRPSGDPVGRRFGYPVYSLLRTDLLATFAAQLPPETIHFESEAREIDPGASARLVRVETADGRTYEADLVVAADGGRSAARRALFPDHPGPADGGYTVWWMLAPGLDDGEEVIASETMGTGAIWGTWPLSDGRIYAYATVLKDRLASGTASAGGTDDADGGSRVRAEDPLGVLRAYFSDWHPQIRRILAAVDPASVYCDDARWMQTPLPAYNVGRVALLGDAAHPMTPDLGQGGSQSIEDAVVLAKLLRKVAASATADGAASTGRTDSAGANRDPLFDALVRYTMLRLPRTTDIVKRSKRMSAFHHPTTPLGTAVRNQVMKLSSSERTVGLFLRSFDPVFGWKP